MAAALNSAERFPLAPGYFDCAGVLDDGALLQQDWARFERVLSPKLEGAWHLHRLTANMPLDHFVLFSSVASVFGAEGQANHAAANAFLDAITQYRHAHGLPALSVNWGPWSETGAAVHLRRSREDIEDGYARNLHERRPAGTRNAHGRWGAFIRSSRLSTGDNTSRRALKRMVNQTARYCANCGPCMRRKWRLRPLRRKRTHPGGCNRNRLRPPSGDRS